MFLVFLIVKSKLAETWTWYDMETSCFRRPGFSNSPSCVVLYNLSDCATSLIHHSWSKQSGNKLKYEATMKRCIVWLGLTLHCAILAQCLSLYTLSATSLAMFIVCPTNFNRPSIVHPKRAAHRSFCYSQETFQGVISYAHPWLVERSTSKQLPRMKYSWQRHEKP